MVNAFHVYVAQRKELLKFGQFKSDKVGDRQGSRDAINGSVSVTDREMRIFHKTPLTHFENEFGVSRINENVPQCYYAHLRTVQRKYII